MNNYYNPPQEVEIDLIDVLWKLLMQWKAVLIVCIICALLVPGVKYAKDSEAYKAEAAKHKELEEQASMPLEERINDVLGALPADQTGDIEFILQQQDMIDRHNEYLSNSILMNTDPDSQRTITAKYIITSDGDAELQTLVDGYDALFRSDAFVAALREVIDPEADPKYIYELIRLQSDPKNSNSGNNSNGNFTGYYDSDAVSCVYSVSIVAPEDIAADAVMAAVDAQLRDIRGELSSRVGEHSLQQLSVEDARLYNKEAVDRRTTSLNSINSFKSNVKNAQSSLSEEQKAALESIDAIKASANAAETAAESSDSASAEPEAPSFSGKYALLGFILGAFLYAGIYVLRIVLKKAVNSAGAVSGLTGSRLLGEMYLPAEHKGLAQLFASKYFAKMRYGDKLDKDRQSGVIADTVDAVCAHHGVDKLTFLLSGVGSEFNDAVELITKKAREAGSGKEISVINADEMDEKALNAVSSAVQVVSSTTRTDSLCGLTSLCADYDVTSLGAIYLEQI